MKLFLTFDPKRQHISDWPLGQRFSFLKKRWLLPRQLLSQPIRGACTAIRCKKKPSFKFPVARDCARLVELLMPFTGKLKQPSGIYKTHTATSSIESTPKLIFSWNFQCEGICIAIRHLKPAAFLGCLRE